MALVAFREKKETRQGKTRQDKTMQGSSSIHSQRRRQVPPHHTNGRTLRHSLSFRQTSRCRNDSSFIPSCWTGPVCQGGCGRACHRTGSPRYSSPSVSRPCHGCATKNQRRKQTQLLWMTAVKTYPEIHFWKQKICTHREGKMNN